MKRKKAAAIKYQSQLKSPIVTAIGFGEIADRIVKEAECRDVPVVKAPELAEKLTSLTLGQNIPVELYEAVAEIIAFIYTLNNRNK